MLKQLALLLLAGASISSYAQVLSTSATITDSDGQIWANGSYSIQIYSPNGTPYYNGTPVPTTVITGTLDGTGAFTGVSLYNTSTITPINASYTFILCSKTSAPCSIFNSIVTSTNLTTTLSALVSAPRFIPVFGSYGYLDAEVISASIGSIYTNSSSGLRYYNGSSWASSGGINGPSTIKITGTNTASTPAIYNNSTPYTSGSSSVDFPSTYLRPAACSDPAFTTNGTIFGISGCGTFDLFDMWVNGGYTLLVGNNGVFNFRPTGSNGGFTVNGSATINTTTGGGSNLILPISAAITSATAGTNITSVTCATGSCTNLRGTYTVVGGTATTGTIATLVWPTTTTAYVCIVTQNDTGVATAYLGLGHTVATATGMVISAGITVIGTTFNVDYSCTP